MARPCRCPDAKGHFRKHVHYAVINPCARRSEPDAREIYGQVEGVRFMARREKTTATMVESNLRGLLGAGTPGASPPTPDWLDGVVTVRVKPGGADGRDASQTTTLPRCRNHGRCDALDSRVTERHDVAHARRVRKVPMRGTLRQLISEGKLGVVAVTATPTIREVAMAPDDLQKELVRRHIDLSWNKADFDALDQLWASDAVVHLWDGRTLDGLDALKKHLRASVSPWTDRCAGSRRWLPTETWSRTPGAFAAQRCQANGER
jgi:hypothetical protein